MTSATSIVDLSEPPAEDVQAVSTACKARVLEREGIAMFIALHDARPGRHLQVRDQPGIDEGRRLAELFGHYERALAAAPVEPALQDAGIEGDLDTHDPTGAAALIEVLVLLSDQHLRARPEQVS